jgi:hypothetical protein
VIQDIPRLETNESVRALAEALIKEGPIPPDSRIDAYHIAISAVHGMDYLLTWNCTHIANAAMRPKVEAVCRNHGYEPPIKQHKVVCSLRDEWLKAGGTFVTTDYVIDETLTLLRYRGTQWSMRNRGISMG